MQKLTLVAALTLLLTPTFAMADQAVPADHSTVHIVFIVPASIGPKYDGKTPNARVGDIMLPVDSLRPISITIDDDFVGHAMVGYTNVEPVFVLPSGVHQFKFSCDGFQETSASLKVLGTGSTQYLIVRMPVDQSKSDAVSDPADAPSK